MTATSAQELTADSLAAALERSECASVLVVGRALEGRARWLIGRANYGLKVAVDPDRADHAWELF